MLTRILLATSLVTMTGTTFSQEQRWLTPADGGLSTDGVVHELELPSGPTTVALDADGAVWGWGALHMGRPAVDPILVTPTVMLLPFPDRTVAVDATRDAIIALSETGSVWTLSTVSTRELTEVRFGAQRALDIDGGVFSIIATLDNGTYATWGDNSLGQLGNGTFLPAFLAFGLVADGIFVQPFEPVIVPGID